MQTLKRVGSFFEKWTYQVIFAGHWHVVHYRCAKHPQHEKHAYSRRVWGHAPPEY